MKSWMKALEQARKWTMSSGCFFHSVIFGINIKSQVSYVQ